MDEDALGKILGSDELKKLLEPTLSPEEWKAYDEWSEKCVKIQREEDEKVFIPGKMGLPVRVVGIDPPPELWKEEVWVWEDEDWEGGAGIGWHRTSMYGGYGPELAGSNWWEEPVCGRCSGNPYWVPGDTTEADLPDMSPEGSAMSTIKAMDEEVSRRVKERSPEFKGKIPNLYDQMAHSFLKLGRDMATALENSKKKVEDD